MKAAGLRGRYLRAWKKTTIPGPDTQAIPGLVMRDFSAPEPNQKWCGDITYIKTFSGWAHLGTVIDLRSRKMVGWALAGHMRTSLVADVLEMAVRHRRPLKGVIFHSDRGTQYTSNDFVKFCRKKGITCSLGKTGICYDNAVSESFNASVKKELIHTKPWPTISRLREELFSWIEEYYNRTRRHSTLGYLTPEEYELGYRHIHELAA
jgi:transposase InsO family protein